MISSAILKWGTEEQRLKWLPPLARGSTIGAFALTEPGTGSDIQSIATEFRPSGQLGKLVLNGEKIWITSAQKAHVFLIFGKLNGQPLIAAGKSRHSQQHHGRSKVGIVLQHLLAPRNHLGAVRVEQVIKVGQNKVKIVIHRATRTNHVPVQY